MKHLVAPFVAIILLAPMPRLAVRAKIEELLKE